MTLIRKDSVPFTEGVSGYPDPYNLGRGNIRYRQISDAGGIKAYGAAYEEILPGGQSSQMHWHEGEDEFLYVLSGELTVVENGVETVLFPGDACAWRAGDRTAHTLRNRSDAPAGYLIVGTRSAEDICHYPGLDMRAEPQGYVHLDGTPYPPRKG
jgi:uncharacterized cupin superfamily protein